MLGKLAAAQAQDQLCYAELAGSHHGDADIHEHVRCRSYPTQQHDTHRSPWLHSTGLTKTGQSLKKLELRRPVNRALETSSQNTAPKEWANMIPNLSNLPNLICLQLTFPGEKEVPTDLASIAAARKLFQESKVKGEKKQS